MAVLTTDKVFLDTLHKIAPKWASSLGVHAPNPLVLSNCPITLSNDHWTIVKNFIKTIHSFSRATEYKNYVAKRHPSLEQWKSKNESVMMSYDFHVTPDGPKLIEVNTNAALSAYSAIWTESLFPGIGQKALTELLKTFEQEASAQGIDLTSGILIVDEVPEKQRAYGEFIIYREFFKEKGWPCEIADVKDVSFERDTKTWRTTSGFSAKTIYNRWNDFTLSQAVSRPLLEGWQAGLLLTPQPIEYILLADKQRIIEWRSSEFAQAIHANDESMALINRVVPETVPISIFDRTAGRSDRAKWFFKPRNSYGSRGVYEGSKISNKTFESILLDDYLAQEIIPPPVVEIKTEEGIKNFKWDLRVYTYKDQPILPMARLYIGQTTNSQTLGGGLSPVQILK